MIQGKTFYKMNSCEIKRKRKSQRYKRFIISFINIPKICYIYNDIRENFSFILRKKCEITEEIIEREKRKKLIFLLHST